jgi:hypothetical protein
VVYRGYNFRMATNRTEQGPAITPADLGGTLTLPETARALGIAPTTLYDAVRRGDPPFAPAERPQDWIPIHVIGTQRRTLRAEVLRYLAGSTAVSA